MKKTILALLLVVGSLYAEYQHNRPQIFYPEYQPPKAGLILGTGEHELRGKGSDGIIELQDGTQFKAIPSHKNAMKYWDYYDQITFCPNPYPFGGSEFYVINEINAKRYLCCLWDSGETAEKANAVPGSSLSSIVYVRCDLMGQLSHQAGGCSRKVNLSFSISLLIFRNHFLLGWDFW